VIRALFPDGLLHPGRNQGNVVAAERPTLSLQRGLNILESKGAKNSSIILAKIVPVNAVTRKTVIAQRMPVRSKSAAAR
jgi:hypothetical protein